MVLFRPTYKQGKNAIAKLERSSSKNLLKSKQLNTGKELQRLGGKKYAVVFNWVKSKG
ncbi:MAG: hypothetical protein QNJ38_10225 [Prochloraceae cyanobacterium]|nr:hypothetical protein [Prochloraceae cyanobacterium]